jgi:hypothetical protein
MQIGVKSITVLVGLMLSPGLCAHPENSPLTFIKHKTEDGRDIYTNIPKRCFSNGLLICARYHPVYNGASGDGG